jgi:hypothetical protein
MQAKPLLSHILDDEALTRGLGDPEARVLVEWLVEQAERLADSGLAERPAWQHLTRLCQRGRAIARFVMLWGSSRTRGAAIQLAAVERFPWPLPTTGRDPCELMHTILQWESQALAA